MRLKQICPIVNRINALSAEMVQILIHAILVNTHEEDNKYKMPYPRQVQAETCGHNQLIQ